MKKQIFIIDNGAYPFDTLVAIGSTDKEIERFLKRKVGYTLGEEDKKAIEMHGTGRTVMLQNGATILRLSFRKYRNSLIATLAHEAFHATVFLFDRVGIKLSNDSDEAFAYHIQHIVTQVLRRL